MKRALGSMLALTLGLGTLLAITQPASTQAPVEISEPQLSAFEKKLRGVRFDLRVDNGKFSGSAAAVLEGAIAHAQYVLIGEDHITREIPQFTTIVCDVMARQGLSAMAVEAGPQVAGFV